MRERQFVTRGEYHYTVDGEYRISSSRRGSWLVEKLTPVGYPFLDSKAYRPLFHMTSLQKAKMRLFEYIRKQKREEE